MADIEAVIAQFENSSWRRIELIAGGVELRLSKDCGATTVSTAATAPAAAATPPSVAAAPAGTVVTAPTLGTFYRAPKPGEPAFVELGQHVAAGQELCLVEVMKLLTMVAAPVAGTVRALHARDGELVEFGQPLVSIDADD